MSRWTPIAGFALVSSANQMLWLNFAPITTGSAHRLGVSTSTIGLLSEIFPLLYVVLAVPAGRALDRWFRSTLAIGAVLTAGGAGLRCLGHGFVPVLIGQIVIAVAQPLVLNAVTGVATRSLDPADRPTGIAAGSAGTFLGFLLAFVLGLALGSAHLHLLLQLSALYALLGAVVLLPSLRHVRSRLASAEVGAAVVTPVGPVWSDPLIRTILAIVFVGFGAFVALTTWAQTLLQPAGVGARGTDGLLIAMVAAGILTSALLPPLVARRALQAPAIAVAAVGGLAACLLLAVAPGAATGYVALALFGLVLLPALPILLELIEQREPERAGGATALLWLSGNAGGLVVALVVGFLTGQPALAFILMALFAVLALPLARRLGTQLGTAPSAPDPAHPVSSDPRAEQR